MIQHYLITAFRIILRQKLYTTIIVLGLALGLSCSTVIMIIGISEVRHDNFHEKGDNIYLVQQTIRTGDQDYTTDRSGGAYGPALKEGLTEIEEFVRFGNPGELLISTGVADSDSSVRAMESDQKFLETSGMATDPEVFKVFTFPMLAGNPETALSQPYSMIVTQNFAEKYFGSLDPIGKIVRINDKYDFTITGLVENVPDNSSQQFEFLLPFSFLEELGRPVDWFTGNPYYTYLLLKENVSYESVSEKLPGFFSNLFEPDTKTRQFLIPLRKAYLFGESGSIAFLIAMSGIAILILLIACINFMNLSTARYLSRTKEIGVRKLAGASRWLLVKQFYGETFLLTFISLNLSLLISDFILGWINQQALMDFSLKLSDPLVIFSLTAILFFSSLVAGSYPAIFLSKFSALDVIRNILSTGKRGSKIRKILVVTQFTFSVILILGTWSLYRQYAFIKTADLGVSRENIIFLSAKGDLVDNFSLFKEKLLTNPDILNVTTASKIPYYIDHGEFEWGEVPEAKNTLARISWVGLDYFDLFDIPLIEGRFYSEEYKSDAEESIVINQSIVDMLGWETAIGKTFYLYDDRYTVIGVVKDFHSFPVTIGGNGLIFPLAEASDFIFIKTIPGEKSRIINFIHEVHDAINPAYPFNYEIFDDYVDPIMQNMSTISPTILGFTLLGIIISCLGLYGLANYTTERRTKEIGIRKAVGSTDLQVIRMLVLENIKLIFIAFLIAFPLGYLLMSMLFKNFTSKINLGPGIFLGTAGIVLVMVMISIGFQSYRSANRNPADSLRYE